MFDIKAVARGVINSLTQLEKKTKKKVFNQFDFPIE
jgi:hypothetical protein